MTTNAPMRLLAFLSLAALSSAARADGGWPQFRGPTGQGLSEAKGLPLTWSETNHVVWKTAIPGMGHSSPVASGDRVWLTSSPDKGKTRHVLRADFKTGRITLDLPLFATDITEPCHAMNSFATPTPVLEGDRVYVTFGNAGTACLDAETGKTIWERRDIRTRYFDVGAASSPVLCKDLLVLTCDGQSDAERFVIALDKNTGKTRWRTDRAFPNNTVPKKTHSSSIPLVIDVAGKALIVSPGGHGVRAYEAETGREQWCARYESWSVVPRPVFADGVLIVCGGSARPTMYGIRPEIATGEVTNTPALLWKGSRNVPTMPSPVLTGKRLYTMTATTLSCLDPATGKEFWSGNIPGQHLASPVAGEGRLYLFNTTGGGAVAALGDTFRILATNRLDNGCYASPAIVGKALLVRTTSHLYRIEE